MKYIGRYTQFAYPLYKYIKLEHAKLFFQDGSIRLNTLFEYVKNETYNDGTRDVFEGFYLWLVNEKDRKDKGVFELRTVVARNQLIMCTSTSKSLKLMNEFEMDCCIEIRSPAFFHYIDAILGRDFRPALVRKVTYMDKTRERLDYEEFAGLVKHDKYEHQDECRALWEPVKPHFGNNLTKAEQDYFFGEDGMQVAISDYLPQEPYLEYIEKEREWLDIKHVKIPDAREVCALLLPSPLGCSEPFFEVTKTEMTEEFWQRVV